MASDLSERILAALGHLVLHYDGAGVFAMKGIAPDWTMRFAPPFVRDASIHVLLLIEAFPVLEMALTDLDSLWVGTRERSKGLGEWVETDGDGNELHIKASLLTLQDVRLLMLSSISEDTVDVIRRARASILRQR